MCASVCVYLYGGVRFAHTYLFLAQWNVEERGANICQGDNDEKKNPNLLFCIA